MERTGDAAGEFSDLGTRFEESASISVMGLNDELAPLEDLASSQVMIPTVARGGSADNGVSAVKRSLASPVTVDVPSSMNFLGSDLGKIVEDGLLSSAVSMGLEGDDLKVLVDSPLVDAGHLVELTVGGSDRLMVNGSVATAKLVEVSCDDDRVCPMMMTADAAVGLAHLRDDEADRKSRKGLGMSMEKDGSLGVLDDGLSIFHPVSPLPFSLLPTVTGGVLASEGDRGYCWWRIARRSFTTRPRRW
ncbi:hypothetical protein Dimus_030826 [Dionaea muscipula]